jgi:hypothetical protein
MLNYKGSSGTFLKYLITLLSKFWSHRISLRNSPHHLDLVPLSRLLAAANAS